MVSNKVSEARNIKTIRELIDTFKKSKLNLTALCMKSGKDYIKLTYGDLQETVQAIGNALLKMGIKKGDRIGLISENRNEWILTYLSVTSIGATIVPFDILLKQEELLHIIRASEVRFIFTSNQHLNKIVESAKLIKFVEKFILFDLNELLETQDSNIVKKVQDVAEKQALLKKMIERVEKEISNILPFKNKKYIYFDSLIQYGFKLFDNNSNYYKKSKVDPEDTAAIIFTSGTTGLPKGVMLSHNNLLCNGDAIQQGYKSKPGENWVVVLPLHHTFPAMASIIVPLLTYAFVTPVPSLKSNVLVQTMKDTTINYIAVVPLLVEKIYKRILSQVKLKPLPVRIIFKFLYGLSRYALLKHDMHIGKLLFKGVLKQLGMTKLNFFICGGGAIPPEIIEGMNILGIRTLQGYGLTETSPVISSTAPTLDRIGSVGVTLVTNEVKIINPDENGNGEILTKGPNVMKGYYKQPEMTAKIIDKDGWLHTGDIGRVDEDGFLYITGRMKNIIVTKSGKNIYPEEIENVLLQCEYFSEAIIVGQLDENGDEYPYAIIHPNMDAIATLETEHHKTFTNEKIEKLIKKELRKITHNMAQYKIPKGFKISFEELPKTSSNKVKRFMFK